MIWLSEILIQDHELSSFVELKESVQKRAISGEIHFGLDVKPQFQDTPDDWEEVLENAFSSAR